VIFNTQKSFPKFMNMKILSHGLFVAAALAVSPAYAEHYHSMTPMTGFGPSATGEILADGSVPFLTTGASQRGLARNPVTGNLIFVDRASSSQGADVSGSIYVLNGTDGSVISTLSTNGIQGGTFADYAVGVADDGAIYVANVVNDTNAGPFKVYRFASESSTDAPTLAFSGILGTNNFRWGNTIDVRGSGPNTQILVSSGLSSGTGGTEAAILTTTDGSVFTANVLPINFGATLQGSLDFGNGNTFWANFTGMSLRLLSFDLDAKTTSIIREIGSPDMPEMTPTEIAAVDNTENLLAVVSFHGSNPDEVLLYDISNTNDLPQLLDSYFISSINNANSGSPHGYLAIGGGKLYFHDLNNGIFAFNLVVGSIPAPTILTQPANKSALQGTTAKFRVVAQRGFAFQWFKGVDPIPGATNSLLVFTNVQFSDEGSYSVIVSNSSGSLPSDSATLTVLSLADFYHLEPLWGTAADAQPYTAQTGGSASSPNQRSFAYSPLTDHLYVVSRGGSSSSIYNVYVVDAETGAQLYTLNTNGVNFTNFVGQIGLVSVDVSDDGSVYACNVDSSGGWKLYRWANDDSNTVPQLVFDGDPFGTPTDRRWGDTMDVRGSGVNTEIVIDSQKNDSPYVAVLQPVDAGLSNFTSAIFIAAPAPSSGVSRSLNFGSDDSIWEKRYDKTTVTHSSFDLSSPFTSVSIIGTYDSFPATLSQISVDESRNLVGAINYVGVTGASPHQLELYDMTDPNSPVFLSEVPFPANARANSTEIGKVILSGDRLFALDSRNGVVAARVAIGAPPPSLAISSSGGNVILSWTGSGYTLESTPDLTSPTWTTVSYTAGSPNTATNAISSGAQFFRLRK
jgi:hypothetical protein